MASKNEILKELECSSCHKYMYDKISMCLTGHSFCKNCKTKIYCPRCNSQFTSGQNFSLENIAKVVLKICDNEGCGMVFDEYSFDLHKYDCEYNYECPFDILGCTWIGHYKNIVKHLLTHEETVVNSWHKVNQNKKDSYEMKIFVLDHTVFKILTKRNQDKFCEEFISVYIGPNKNAKKYLLQLKYKDTGDGYQFLFVQPCSPMDTKDCPKICISDGLKSVMVDQEIDEKRFEVTILRKKQINL